MIPPTDGSRGGECADAFRHCHAAAKAVQSAPVLHNLVRSKHFLAVLACAFSTAGLADEITPQSLEVVISVAEQRLVVLRDGGLIRKFPISTSRFGLGDSFGSYKTPLGHLRVCEKVGDDFACGTVIKHRAATGEVLAANAAGRDPIVTRILWLDGLDEQNRNAKGRGIYIHGTTEESRLGKPVSWGCIRMRSSDVIDLYTGIPLGTPVNIIAEKLPKLHKYVAPPPVIIASNTPPAKVAPDIAAKKSDAHVHLASNPKPAGAARLSEIASGPGMVPADPGAAQALKGSILSAGLPDAPATKAGPQKQDKMTFHSWSAVSLREATNASGPTGPR